jgi:hypothetical protein
MDQKEYRSMIGSLLYLTTMRPDIQFMVCLCARFQSSPRTSHHQAVKQILGYLCFAPEFDLWFLASSSLSLCRYSDVDYAGYRVERKSTWGLVSFLDLLLCLGLLARSLASPNPPQKLSMLLLLLVVPSCFG